MYYSVFNLLKILHGSFGCVLFLFFFVLFIKVLFDFLIKNKNLLYTKTISQYFIFTTHIQLCIGFLLFIINPKYFYTITQKIGNTSIVYVDHIASNIIGIILITIFNKKLKKSHIISINLIFILISSIVFFFRVFPLIIQFINQ